MLRTFDLSKLADAAEKDSRGRRRFVRLIGILGVAFVIVGIVLLLSIALPLGVAGSVPGAILVVLGLMVVGMAWFVSAGVESAPRRLVITSEYLSFELVPGRADLKMRWDNPRFKLTIYDGSGLSSIRRDRRPREADFVAEVSWFPQAPLTQGAYEAILDEATLHGLQVDRRRVPTSEVGHLERISIQPA